MRFDKSGVPLIVLSHRTNQFLGRTLASIRHHAIGIGEVFVVDDSGDDDHREWLADHGFNMTAPEVSRNVGYLASMEVVWDIAACTSSDYVLLWEEDFHLTRALDVADMVQIMSENSGLAHLNLQRQSVYRVEKRFGYMESHQRRGYELTRQVSITGKPWVARRKPFTTNPGLLRRSVAQDIGWPTRQQADLIRGGAEPAMSLRLEQAGWYFGWYGRWNTPYTTHVGADHKTGTGY